MYNEAIRLSILKYRQKNKDKINEKTRERYAKLKLENPEKYRKIVDRAISDKCARSKEQTKLAREIKSLMRIEIF